MSCDEQRPQLEAFLEEEKLPWKIAFSDEPEHAGMDNPLADHYGVISIPCTILVGKDGTVLALNPPDRQLHEELVKLLGKASRE